MEERGLSVSGSLLAPCLRAGWSGWWGAPHREAGNLPARWTGQDGVSPGDGLSIDWTAAVPCSCSRTLRSAWCSPGCALRRVGYQGFLHPHCPVSGWGLVRAHSPNASSSLVSCPHFSREEQRLVMLLADLLVLRTGRCAIRGPVPPLPAAGAGSVPFSVLVVWVQSTPLHFSSLSLLPASLPLQESGRGGDEPQGCLFLPESPSPRQARIWRPRDVWQQFPAQGVQTCRKGRRWLERPFQGS